MAIHSKWGSSINSVQWFDSSGTFILSGDSIVYVQIVQLNKVQQLYNFKGKPLLESDTVYINVLNLVYRC